MKWINKDNNFFKNINWHKVYQPIDMIIRGDWETGVQSQVKSYQAQKWYLVPPYIILSIIRYGSSVSEAIQGKE